MSSKGAGDGTMDGAKASGGGADQEAPEDDAADELFDDGGPWDFDTSGSDLPRAAGLFIAAFVVVAGATTLASAYPSAIGLATGIVVLAALVYLIAEALRAKPRRWDLAAIGVVVTGLAITQVVEADESTAVAVGRGAGVALVVVGGVVLWRSRSGRDGRADAAAEKTAGAVAAGFGVAMITMPLVTANVTFVVAAALAAGSLLLRSAIAAGFLPVRSGDGGLGVWIRWLRYNARTNKSRRVAVEEFYFEGDAAPGRFLRFSLLMMFAAGIATMGVVTDSTAVVIGAMLIAPLITPLMGMALALPMGWPIRLGHCALTTLIGVVIAVGAGAVLTLTLGVTVDMSTNSQIVSRTSPTVSDLMIALFAGAAGAYANARRDVASALPGVAIAIALVPPLAVVGVTGAHGAWELSAGALLLFVTNMIAILAMGGIVFLLTGLAPFRQVASHQYRVRTAVIALAFVGLMVVGALTLNGEQITSDALIHDRLQNVVNEWLGDDSDFGVIEVTVEDGTATIVLAGPGDPPDLASLASAVDDEFDDTTFTLDVQWIARQRQILGTTS